MRLFVAIPLSEEATRELGETAARIRKRPGADELRWSPPESWHVTLQFLGNVAAEEYVCLLERLRGVRASPVKIGPQKIGAFGHAGILHVEVKPTPELLELERGVIAATSQCGFTREDRPYRPHITLARRRARSSRNGIASTAEKSLELKPFTGFTAAEFAFYESFLGSAARYEIRQRFPLAR